MKEEPKQENCCTPIGQIKRYLDSNGCDRKPKQEFGEPFVNTMPMIKEKPNEEAIKEALERFRRTPMIFVPNEIKYSEEEVLEIIKKFDKEFYSGIVERNKGVKYWFEQFKNKQ